MSKPAVYLICGVSGSGKTWVCRQLAHKFNYIPHDEHYRDILTAIGRAEDDKPVITECPFGERILRGQLEREGYKVVPYFVVEDTRTVQDRYKAREKKDLPKAAATRSVTIIERAKEWKAPYGTSAEILDKLKRL